jgi:hypothetical protein
MKIEKMINKQTDFISFQKWDYDPSILDKINEIIDKLNSLGRLGGD